MRGALQWLNIEYFAFFGLILPTQRRKYLIRWTYITALRPESRYLEGGPPCA